MDAGGLRSRETDKVETTRSEKDLFRILELDWIREFLVSLATLCERGH